MSLYLVHVDDSPIMRRLVKDALKSSTLPIELLSYASVEEATTAIQSNDRTPWLLLTDWNMPGETGIDLVRWMKSHPRFYSVPIAFLTAEKSDECRAQVKALGGYDFISKPFTPDDLAALLARRHSDTNIGKQFDDVNMSFFENTHELVSELRAAFANSTSDRTAHLCSLVSRHLHTIKGSALTLHWTILAEAIHSFETYWDNATTAQATSNPFVRVTMSSALSYIDDCMTALRNNKQHPLVSDELIKAIDVLFETFSTDQPGQTRSPDLPLEAVGDESSGRARSLRISVEKLDEFQTHVKRIVQLKTKLSTFTNQLAQEFEDESFIRDLRSMSNGLGEASQGLMEFFLTMRLAPVSRLKKYCESCANDTASRLGKSFDFDFKGDLDLEVDRQVIDLLEGSLAHLIRNAIDHGIESPSERSRLGKPPVGRLSLEIRLVKGTTSIQDRVQIQIKDDGPGIDTDLLISKVKRLGLMDASALIDFPREKALDFIFLDQVSTKETVSEISGRGVGLGAVRQELQSAGASLKVDSTLGQGTTFTIDIPKYFNL